MRAVPFKQVDVFTRTPYAGNPVAVILDAEGLDAGQMQQIARWTNLSETAFVLPPTAASANYRVRIFTPRQELPFAGHPSVGTAHAVLEAGLAVADEGALVQECAAGLLPVRIERAGDGRRIHVRAPDATLAPVVDGDVEALRQALGVAPLASPAPQVVDNGPHWWVAGFSDEATLRGLEPDMGRLAALTAQRKAVGVAAWARSNEDGIGLVVRCFCPGDGIPEDPVTGSGNAAVAAFLQAHDALPGEEWIASQGREVGRDGRVVMAVRADGIHLGGRAITVVDGLIRLT